MITVAPKFAVLAALVLAATGAVYAPAASARTSVSVQIGVAPPPPRYEVVPPPRPGYVWIQGYWNWDPYAHRHVWIPGRWTGMRPGYVYHPARWEHYGNQWRFHDGRWGR